MKQIEKSISPLIDSLFPSFYQEEGPNFVAFVKAYYEWLEQNFQLLSLESNTGFVKGATIQQDNVTGVIHSFIEDDILVKISNNDTFKCFNVCSELIPVTTVNPKDGLTYSTYILKGGSARRLGSIFTSRNLLDYRDIDETIDLFVVFFKEKYLKNIEFDTATNKRLLVKNALDLYRAKGTERAVDLFFRLVYGVKPEVEYPADVLFQPSAAEWFKPRYIEISPNTASRAIDLVGKEITGLSSGAKAFVEKYVKLKVTNGYSHVLFISNIKGNFIPRESIIDDDLFPDSPIIYGSLSEIFIQTSSSGFAIGDIIPVTTSTGINALARVTAVKDANGQLEFELTEEGYGYSTNFTPSALSAQTVISDRIITVSNVVSGNVVTSIAARSAGGGYTNGQIITITSSLGRNANCVILTDSSGGVARIDVADPGTGFNVPTGAFTLAFGSPAVIVDYATSPPREYYKLFDTIKQFNGATEIASGMLIGSPLEAVVEVTSPTGDFPVDGKIYQVDSELGEIASGTIIRSNISLLGGTIEINNVRGRFRSNRPVLLSGGDSTATFSSISLKIPVKVTSSSFQSGNLLKINSTDAGFTSNTSSLSSGAGGALSIFELRNDKETIQVNTDVLANNVMLNLPLNSLQFNLPQSLSSNVSSNIFGALTFQSLEVGEVETLLGINPGNGYSEDPVTLLYQPYVANFDYDDLSLTLGGTVTDFRLGEKVTQEFTESVYEVVVSSTAGLRINEAITINDGPSEVGSGKVKSLDSGTRFTINEIEGPISAGYTVKSVSNTAFSKTVTTFSSKSEDVIVKGRVKSQDGNILVIKRMNFNRDFVLGEEVVGSETGATGTVIDINEVTSAKAMGENSTVLADAVTADGEILSAQVVDSGFGYKDGQLGSTLLDDRRRITYTTAIGGLGTGSGSYRSLKGFLSDLSKLHDGDFYQEYSYNILSKISFEKYSEMFKKVLHTAGTRFFGNILLSSVIEESAINVVANTQIDVSNVSPFVIFAPELDAAPVPWGATSVSDQVRLDDEPVADYANVHIEIRN